jgi:hypothetical protein|nr:MAG TPA: hypothetical protein [Caudoviricetes sp.]
MRNINIKLAVLTLLIAITLVGCERQADKVSYNLSKEADNFNVVRELTVINAIQGDVLFTMTGKMTIKADVADNQLEVIVEDENRNYQKHFIGLSDNVTYVVEQKGYKNVENYKYTLNYNPKMWIPVEVEIID